MTPRIVLGMTLYNNARHLREAADSLLAQSRTDFVLLMLDDGSRDETEAIAREYERRDARVRFFQHPERQGMIPTWREVAERASRDYPEAAYFAWVSDHDRWHPEWLARLAAELDAHPDVVLAYPLSPRINEDGTPGLKEPRTFDTHGIGSVQERWSRFCYEGVGAGDIVYGVARIPALRAAGIFRSVLRPDRLLLAELTLHGQIRQVDEPLWFRRETSVSSVARQSVTLFAGSAPRWFVLPPWLQHGAVLFREYGGPTKVGPYEREHAPLRIPRVRLAWMVLLYGVTYTWRHIRKTETSHRIGRGVDNAYWVKKVIKKAYHYAVYETLVAMHAVHGRLRRVVRGGVRDFLILTHRLGLRSDSQRHQ